jgi:hypothetical protein
MIQSRKFDSSLSWKTLLAKCFKSPESWPGHCQFDTMVQISNMIEYSHTQEYNQSQSTGNIMVE